MPITLLETVFTMKGTMQELRALEKLLGSLPEARRDTEITSSNFTPGEWKALGDMYRVISSHNMPAAV